MTVEARFWAKVKKTDGCWLWTAFVDAQGNARFGINGKNTQARRVAYQLAGNVLTDGVVVPTCRNKICVRPGHLEQMPLRAQRARLRCDPTERFWARVIKTDECWVWTGATDDGGYGIVMDHALRRPVKTHRLSWEMNVGAIPEGLWVLHKCDNPPCVRPDHLFLGTPQDNVDDCVQKGRKALGEAMNNSKVGDADVRQIRERRMAGTPRKEVAAAFGISKHTVTLITTRRSWKHVV